MARRPYVLLSAATSLDGYLDDATPHRLILSNQADLDLVDGVRAGCDAILVGAGTIRADDPRLLVRSERRRRERVAGGLAPSPAKVTLTRGGDLDPSAAFFADDGAAKLVYVTSGALARTTARLAGRAEIVDGGEPLDAVFDAWLRRRPLPALPTAAS